MSAGNCWGDAARPWLEGGLAPGGISCCRVARGSGVMQSRELCVDAQEGDGHSLQHTSSVKSRSKSSQEQEHSCKPAAASLVKTTSKAARGPWDTGSHLGQGKKLRTCLSWLRQSFVLPIVYAIKAGLEGEHCTQSEHRISWRRWGNEP